MDNKHASSFASRSKAPVGWGRGHGTTPGGSRARAYQTRAQTKAQANPQPEIMNGERVQEHVVQDAPSTMPAAAPIVALHTDVVMRLLNVLQALVPNHCRLPIPQNNSQA
ncbi:hypothetical protein HAX54_035741 [Datura stramonium]|uniref:Uncharacterized protein n=1 Tax=Datura stramonium TaxID=4076 RepID=A0ABS8SFP7_DATST|nr:hypothetical protein [Datura stramonium]